MDISQLPGAMQYIVLGLSLIGLVVVFKWARSFLQSLMGHSVIRPFVSVALIVKNQEALIEGLLRNLLPLSAGEHGGLPYEVLVVDAGSTDDTPLIVERLARRNEEIRFFRMGEVGESGQSASELALFLSRSRVVVFLDLQGQVEIQSILRVMEYLLSAKGDEKPSYLLRFI
jgi:glycosyltransferase involved in cell wall biosynthesis